MAFDEDAAFGAADGFADFTQQRHEAGLQVGVARAERALFGQADDDLGAVAHDFGFARVDFFGQVLADALEFGVGVHFAAAAACTAGFACAASTVGGTGAHVAHFHRGLHFGLHVGHFGKEFDFALRHGARLLGAFGGRACGLRARGRCARRLRARGRCPCALRARRGVAALAAARCACAALLLARWACTAARRGGGSHFDHDFAGFEFDLGFASADFLGQGLLGGFERLLRFGGDVGFELDVFFAVVGGFLLNGFDGRRFSHRGREVLRDQALGLGRLDGGDDALHTEGVFHGAVDLLELGHVHFGKRQQQHEEGHEQGGHVGEGGHPAGRTRFTGRAFFAFGAVVWPKGFGRFGRRGFSLWLGRYRRGVFWSFSHILLLA